MNLPAKVAAALTLASSLAGCATTNLSPHTGSRLSLDEDEKRLWLQAEDGEKRLDRSGLVEKSPELDPYLAGIARKLFPDIPFEFRIRVMRDAGMNAFALPNGAIYLHTGLLARMENEAQLAALLGHEGTHAVSRHSVKGQRELLNKSVLYSAVTLGGWGGSLFTTASVTGYRRDLEREADAEGFHRMVAAGYDPSEAPKLFRILEQWIKDTGVKDPYFFSSHPKVKERIESFESLTAAAGGGKGIVNRELFLAKTRGVVLETAELDLKAGRYESALRGADKYLLISGGDAKGHFLRGETLHQRNGTGDGEQAFEEYRRAVSADASYPEPYRALGLIHYKKSEKADARKYLEKYLMLNPGAPDRSYIEGYIRTSQ